MRYKNYIGNYRLSFIASLPLEIGCGASSSKADDRYSMPWVRSINHENVFIRLELFANGS